MTPRAVARACARFTFPARTPASAVFFRLSTARIGLRGRCATGAAAASVSRPRKLERRYHPRSNDELGRNGFVGFARDLERSAFKGATDITARALTGARSEPFFERAPLDEDLVRAQRVFFERVASELSLLDDHGNRKRLESGGQRRGGFFELSFSPAAARTCCAAVEHAAPDYVQGARHLTTDFFLFPALREAAT